MSKTFTTTKSNDRHKKSNVNTLADYEMQWVHTSLRDNHNGTIFIMPDHKMLPYTCDKSMG